MAKIKLSAVVITRNEEANLSRCLKSLVFCDEILVIDDYSQDKTVVIARKFGARVFRHHLHQDFAAQRNFGLKKARGEWVFFVDADERVSPALAAEIKAQLAQPQSRQLAGFYLKRRDFFGGRWLQYGETAKVKLLRLARKRAGRWQRAVHETWVVKGKVRQLKEPLLHYPHPTLSQFLQKINFYTSLNATEFLREGKKTNLGQILVYPLGKFFQNYLFRLGFLDGMPGFIVALMMSLHSFLTRAKLYLLINGHQSER